MQLGCRSCGSWLIVWISVVWLSACASQDTQDLQRYIEQVKLSAEGQPLGPLPDVDPYRPYPYEAGALRDPFAYARFVVDAMTRQERPEPVDPLFVSGVMPDFNRPREELERYNLDALRLVGTFRDFATNDLWALVRTPDGVVHRVREGNYVGQNHGEIYAVTQQGVEIQEIVQDPNGGWRERENRLPLAE